MRDVYLAPTGFVSRCVFQPRDLLGRSIFRRLRP